MIIRIWKESELRKSYFERSSIFFLRDLVILSNFIGRELREYIFCCFFFFMF